ncbi:S-adenosyl-L-methionine-dependent methyltransferase [Ochromonadaceae sp. CCMP2298]|nr:S-adenosyl-L-methionine-dependent methyltransferase [Ochromonadaceae sp. CCMP2298]|mmetsp:Transcript_10426/g.23100  ORF Transcript_10426/g.23100 Transcript_10426/m.23100 type:complete len:365 (+) Transcript_10426:41-1135(+)
MGVLLVLGALLLLSLERAVAAGENIKHHTAHSGDINNTTIAGSEKGCVHQSTYFINPNVRFQMCMGQTAQDLKNGMSIINLVNNRGFLPTCRVMQLMLWMAAEVGDKGALHRDTFVDIGANIGSCTVHMAALGFPVISVEPVQQHVDTIQGSIDINPSFHIDLQHCGLSTEERVLNVNFGHGTRNWGASEFHEADANAAFETTLQLRPLDKLVGHRRVSLLKVDCEGCEWETLKSARRVLKRTPMIKLELVQPSYTAGNETISAADIVKFLNTSGFSIFADHWNEQQLYFGLHHKEIFDVDRLFGSDKFSLGASPDSLSTGARLIISNPIDAQTFSQKKFLEKHTDIIAIETNLAERMKTRWVS